MEYIYRLHAIERMFQRDIEEYQIEEIIENGEIIESYLDDKPYPSYLVFGYSDNVALHVVYAKDNDNNNIVITVYKPNLIKWEKNYKTRRI